MGDHAAKLAEQGWHDMTGDGRDDTGRGSSAYWWPSAVAIPKGIVVLCHGLGEHTGRYEGFARLLASHGFHVIGLDMTGHGRVADPQDRRGLTGSNRFDVEAEARALHSRVERTPHDLPDGDRLPIHVFGHSLGAQVAVLLAGRLRRRLGRVIISAGALSGWLADADLEEPRLLPPIRGVFISSVVAEQISYDRDPRIWHTGVPASLLKDLRARWAHLEAAAEEIRSAPILWLHGVEDRLISPQICLSSVVAYGWENVMVRYVPGARHELFHDAQAERCMSQAVDFLKEDTPRY